MMMSTVEPNSVPIFVINLDRDVVRLTNIGSALAKLGRSYERVRAIDAKSRISLLRRVVKRPMHSSRAGKPLMPGEVGCALSHVSALKRVIRRRLPLAVILEDDAEWDERFGRFLSHDLVTMMQSFDVLKFEGLISTKRPGWGITLARGSTARAVLPLKGAFGSAGYVVTLEGARLLASALGRLDEPVDFVLPRSECYGFVLGETRPFLAWQGPYPTNIESIRWENAPGSALSPRKTLISRLRNRATGILRRWSFMAITVLRHPRVPSRRA
jgi:glycosyl transferase, family 25